MTQLRDHVAVEHGQGAAAYQGDDESVAIWHDQCEHRPGRTTHVDHAHDEVTARRHGVTLLDGIIPDPPPPPCQSAWRCPSGYPKGTWGCRNFHANNKPIRLGRGGLDA